MDFVVICNPDDRWEADRVVDEAKIKKLGAEVLHYENFQVQIVGGELTIFYKNTEWKMPKWVVFRSANYLAKKTRYDELAYILRDHVSKNGGIVLNYNAMKIGPFGKLRQQYDLNLGKLSCVDTYYGFQKPSFLPIVQKPLQGSSGDGVRLVSSESEIKIEELSVYQKVMERGCDYRVIVIGGKAVGAIERRAADDMFVANVSKGATAKSVELAHEVIRLAEQATDLFGLEYAGVDLIKDLEGGWHILEINRFAQFQGFEKATGINVAGKVVKYLTGE